MSNRGRGGRGNSRGNSQNPSNPNTANNSNTTTTKITTTNNTNQTTASSPSSSAATSSSPPSHSSPAVKLRPAVFKKVGDLEPASSGHNIRVKVVESKIVLDKPRTDGSRFIIHEALVGDDSGCILLTMRNEQATGIKAGSSITIRNAKIEMFKNHMRLAVDQWGLIEPSDRPLNENVNKENNLSTTEYELVEM